jgi:hypothetical protein
MSTFNVYRVIYWGMVNHHSIFVEWKTDGSGELYHVEGSVAEGFVYVNKGSQRPENSQKFSMKTHLGKVESSKKKMFGETCEKVPAPGKRTNRDCVKWVDEAIEALKKAGVLIQ